MGEGHPEFRPFPAARVFRSLGHGIHQLSRAGFREHGIDLPFPPFQMRLESLDGRKTARTLTSAGNNKRPAGSL